MVKDGATGSTVPRRQLGRLLRKLREEAGISVADAAAALERSAPTLWRIEKGTTPMRAADVEAMCRLYGADAQTTQALVALARETRARGWWHAYGDTIPAWFEVYVGLEAAASRLRIYDAELIPGLLQTRAYAEGVIRLKPDPPEEHGRRVAVRLERQRLLTRAVPPPPTVEVIVGEAALLARPLPPAGMREQVLRLLQVAELPRVSLRLLPLAAGFHQALNCGARFTIVEFPPSRTGVPEPPVVYADNLTGAVYLDRPNEVAAYDAVWDSLTCALSIDETRKLIASERERYS